jgi:hypothetical protein
MASEITNARRMLNLLSEKKIEDVASLLRSSDGLTKAEANELADYFDPTLPYSGDHQFKFVIKQRRPGNRRPRRAAEYRAYENGGKIEARLRRNVSAGEPENVLKAIGDVLDNWSSEDDGKPPAEKTLKRDHLFYRETNSMNPTLNGMIKISKWPPLKR